MSFPAKAVAADPGRCPPAGEAFINATRAGHQSFQGAAEEDQYDGETSGFRRLAAPFTPDIVVRLWYQQRRRTRSRARAHAIAQPARPDRILTTSREPFGWQISVRWDLVDIADTFLPDYQTPLRLYASDCAVFQRSSDSLWEFWVQDESENPAQGEHKTHTREGFQ